MAAFISKHRAGKRDQIVVIALGSRTTTAVYLAKQAEGCSLLNFALLESPGLAATEGLSSIDMLAEHFRKLRKTLGAATSKTVIVLNSGDSILRQAEMPRISLSLMRRLLEAESKRYLQEDLAGYQFDCFPFEAPLPSPAAASEAPTKGEPVRLGLDKPASLAGARDVRKMGVIVGGAKRQVMNDLLTAAKAAGLQVVQITINQSAQAGALKHISGPLTDQAVATLDLGYESSRICLLLGGELVHARVVPLGGCHLTRGLAEQMKISFEAAEGVKTMLANKAEPQLKTLVSPLASELKASMDYFETTYEKGVNRCYVFGRSAQSSVILKLLQDHELVPLQPWEFPPPPAFTVAQPKQAESQRLAPELGLAVGAGMAWLDGKAKTLNLLATQQEADEARRRDPLRLGGRLALGLLALMVLWSALIGLKMMLAQHQLVGCRTQLAAVEKASGEVTENYRQVVKNEAQFNALVHQATHRFLAAPLLDALQRSTVENLVLTKLHVDRAVNTWALDAEGAKKRARSTEVLTLTIQAKDYTDLGATEDFISALATNPYFAGRLSSPEAIVLKNRVPRQVDTEDPARSFSLVTLECVFKEREIGRE